MYIHMTKFSICLSVCLSTIWREKEGISQSVRVFYGWLLRIRMKSEPVRDPPVFPACSHKNPRVGRVIVMFDIFQLAEWES